LQLLFYSGPAIGFTFLYSTNKFDSFNVPINGPYFGIMTLLVRLESFYLSPLFASGFGALFHLICEFYISVESGKLAIIVYIFMGIIIVGFW
jgi:hypothetical protein